jgi:hypothetical protein
MVHSYNPSASHVTKKREFSLRLVKYAEDDISQDVIADEKPESDLVADADLS